MRCLHAPPSSSLFLDYRRDRDSDFHDRALEARLHQSGRRPEQEEVALGSQLRAAARPPFLFSVWLDLTPAASHPVIIAGFHETDRANASSQSRSQVVYVHRALATENRRPVQWRSEEHTSELQ